MKKPLAITCDVWGTILVDGSDDLKRTERGLPTKAEERARYLTTALQPFGIGVEEQQLAWDRVQELADAEWTNKSTTWGAGRRIQELEQLLAIVIPEEARLVLVNRFERMEADVLPALAPGAAEALEELAQTFSMGVVCDTFFSPGRVVFDIFTELGIAGYFQGWAFSDEVMRSKPHPLMFERACEALHVQASDAVHIGDRYVKDVRGASRLGFGTILYTGIRAESVPPGNVAPDWVCESWSEIAERLQSR